MLRQLLARAVGRAASGVRYFLAARRATAAIEFAFVLPVALILYAGAAQVSDGVTASRKTTVLTRTLVDLLSLQPTSSQLISTPTPANAVTAATLSSLMTSAQVLLYPEPTTGLQMTLTAVDMRNLATGVCCVATVRWSYTQNGTLRPCGNVNATLPSDLVPTGTVLPQSVSYLIADVSYTYKPIVTLPYFNFSPTMKRTQYMMPRAVGQVITGALPATGTQKGVVCY